MAQPVSPEASSSSGKRSARSPGQYPSYEEMLEQRNEDQQRDIVRLRRRTSQQTSNVICANVPLPPQTYDEPTPHWLACWSDCFPDFTPSTSTGLRSRTSIPEIPYDLSANRCSSPEDDEEIPVPRRLEYPKPAIPYSYEHLYLGANKTLIPWSFYISVPWHSYELSARYLAEYIFGKETLCSHRVHGKKQLDRLVVEDIVTHVSERCSVGEEYVVFIIAKLCSDFAKLSKDGLLNTSGAENN